MYDFDVIYSNGEMIPSICDRGMPLIQIVPGLYPAEKQEAEQMLRELVEMESGEMEMTLECVKDDVTAIDVCRAEDEIDRVLDILSEVQSIIKSKEAKRLLKKAIDALEDDVRHELECVDTCVELTLERINKFLEKGK